AQEAALQIISRSQRRPRARVIRVHLGGFLKVVNRTVKRIAAPGSQVDHPAREALVRFDGLCFVGGDVVDLGGRKLEVQPLAQLKNDLVLKVEYLADLAVDLYGADDFARAHVDHPSRYANHLTDALITAAEYPLRRKPAAYIDRNRLVEFVERARLKIFQHLECSFASDDRKALHLFQVGRDGLGDPRADPLIL